LNTARQNRADLARQNRARVVRPRRLLRSVTWLNAIAIRNWRATRRKPCHPQRNS